MVLTQAQIQDVRDIIKNSMKTLISDKEFLLTLAKSVAESVQLNLEKTFEDQNKVISAMNQRITSLEDQNKKLCEDNNKLANDLDDLQQYSRRNCLRIFGIPEQKDENPVDVVLNFFSEKFKNGIDASYIDRAHRVGKISNHSRPLIVKFVSYAKRKEIFDNKRMLKGSGCRISEDLTKRRLLIFKTAIEKFRRENVWTSDGIIMIRRGNTKTAVRRMEDLTTLT